MRINGLGAITGNLLPGMSRTTDTSSQQANLVRGLPQSADALSQTANSLMNGGLTGLNPASLTGALSSLESSLAASAPAMRNTPLTAGSILNLPTQPANTGAPINFAEHVTQAIHHLNDLQNHANTLSQQVATGSVEDAHTAMIAMEQASLAFDYTLEVRNKVLDAYQQIMQTQV